MAWDKNVPEGATTQVNLVDDAIRVNNAALETALDAEHNFATGGAQTGRHQFGFGTTAARDAIADLLIDGALWIATGGSIPAGFAELQVRDQSGLQWLDASGRQFLQLANDWLAGQYSSYVTLATSGAVASDWADSNFFRSTLTGNITLSNPTNKPAAGKGGTWIYEFIQGGAGGYTLTLGGQFKTQLGFTPVLSTAVGAVDVLVCTLLGNGDIYAELSLDIK